MGGDLARMSELKPCPFCGGEAIVRPGDSPRIDSDVRFAGCEPCGIYGMFLDGLEAEAIAAWNRRVSGWVSVDEGLPEFSHDECEYDLTAPFVLAVIASKEGVGQCVEMAFYNAASDEWEGAYSNEPLESSERHVSKWCKIAPQTTND